MKAVLKSAFGVSFLAFGVWAAADLAFGPTATLGVLNAPLHVVRAETAGRVSMLAESGTSVRAKQLIGKIIVDVGAPPFGAGAYASATSARLAIPSARIRLEALESAIAEIDDAAAKYQISRVELLANRVREMDFQVEIAGHDLADAERALLRAESLFTSRHVSLTTIETARSLSQRKLAEKQLIETQRASRQSELDAARQGIFVGEGANDLSASAHRRSDLAVQIADLRAELARLDRFADPTAHDMAETSLVSSIVTAPRDGQIWSVSRSEGEKVMEGDELHRIADCSRLFVNATLSPDKFGGIRIGQRAEFTEMGSKAPLQGKVVRLNGTFGTEQIPSSIPEHGNASQHAVVVALDSHKYGACNIGMIGTLVFDGAPGLGLGSRISTIWSEISRLAENVVPNRSLPSKVETSASLTH